MKYHMADGQGGKHINTWIDPGEIEVRMEGGSFRVTVSRDLDVVLRGPVREVGTGELSEGFVLWLGAGS